MRRTACPLQVVYGGIYLWHSKPTVADEYLADQLFIKHKVPVKFGKEYCKNNSRYCVISCKIRKRYEEEFKKALAEMDNKMILRGYTDYADFCENFNTIIDKARCEL